MYDHILVATDGSEHAGEAARHALEAAKRYDATLHALYVVESRTAYDNAIVDPDEVRANLHDIGEDALNDIRELSDERTVDLTTTIEEGVPAEEILSYCETNGIDSIFIGDRGHSAFKTVLLGSTTETVLQEADVPVTIV